MKLQIDEPAAVAGFDSVSVCLSKGLGAPGGFGAAGFAEFHCAGAALAQGSGRWHAAGRRARRGGDVRPGAPRATACTGSRKRRRFSPRGCAPWDCGSSLRKPTCCTSTFPRRWRLDLKAHLERRGILATIAPRTRLVTHLDLPRAKVEAALQAFRDFPHWDSVAGRRTDIRAFTPPLQRHPEKFSCFSARELNFPLAAGLMPA